MSPFFFVSPPLKERAEKNGSIRDSTSSSLESICNNYLKLFRGVKKKYAKEETSVECKRQCLNNIPYHTYRSSYLIINQSKKWYVIAREHFKKYPYSFKYICFKVFPVIYILRNISKMLHLSIGRGVAVLPASRRHECHLNRRLPGKAERYTSVYDWWSPPFGPLGRTSSYECTHSSNRAALIEGGHPWNAFSLLAHKTRRAPTTKPIHAHPWIGAKLRRFIGYKGRSPFAGK